MTSHTPSLRCLLVALAVCGLAATKAVRGQEPEAKYSAWSKVENARETSELRQQLRDGGPFDAKARDFVVQVVLPQLGMEANRPTIERVRRRIRDLLLADIADEKAFGDAAKTVVDAMAAVAQNRDVDSVVRVNAMLLVGDLRSKEGRPLPMALAMLATVAADVRLPLEVRIAAAAGMARHAEAAKASGQVAEVAKAVAPAIGPMLSAPPSVAGDWLAGRALAIVQTLGRQTATKDALAAAARILGDGTRSVDLRVRAAAALGAAAAADSGVDVGRAVDSIPGVALAGLQADAAAADSLRAERGLPVAGGSVAGLAPVGGDAEPAVPQLVCRRNAWRLWTCAEALLSEDGTTGLGPLLGGDAAAAAGKTAATLRQAAAMLDTHPDEQSLLEAIELLSGKEAAAAGANPAPAVRPKERPGTDAPARGDSPFDATPFGP
ncbi:MAG: hypothetical protein ACKOC4_05305 [Planctomycetia bacterium]